MAYKMNINKYLVSENITIKNALKRLNEIDHKCLIIVKKKYFLGTLTDGDIRKYLVKNTKINIKIKKIYNKKSIFFYKNKYSQVKANFLIKKNKIPLIPILNNSNLVINFVSNDTKINPKIKKISKETGLIIMAGGVGRRMRPFTHILPKPLLPINEKPVIEHILSSFEKYGFNEAYISINKKSKILQAYFQENRPNIKLKFLKEIEPLGTAGSINLLKKKYKNIFISNCDTILNANFKEALDYHVKNNFDILIFSFIKNYRIPYGVCKFNKEKNFIQIIEKPKIKFLINSGIYIIKNNIIKLIPKNKKIDFPDLIKLAKKNNKKIGTFLIKEKSWFDVGQWSLYEKTIKILKE
jgi:dTDP-glucose pyrophosphorylase/predicted transcriptional regulator